MRRLLLAGILCALSFAGSPSAYAAPPIKHVFVLVDENESASTTFGSGSPAPYLSKVLVAQGAYLPNYYGIGHSSLDNYIAMVSGQAPNPLTSGDCQSFVNFSDTSMSASGQMSSQGCVYPTAVPTLMSQLEGAGLSWRAYEDGMGADPARESATCGHPEVGAHDNTETASAKDQYATRHDPFVYFHSVIDNQAECNAKVVNLSQLPSDLQSAATTPSFAFITPNLCNDGHDATCANGGPGGLTQADSFLQTWVPRITSSPAFQQNGLLIVVFDEAVGDSSACCNEMPGPFDAANKIMSGGSGPGGGVVGAVLLSPFITPGTTSSTNYNHYSLLGSVEDIFGLARIGYAQGANAFGADVFAPPSAPSSSTGELAPVALAPASVAAPPASTPTPPGSPPPSLGVPQLIVLLAREITPSGRAAKIGQLLRHHGVGLRFRAPQPGSAVVQWYRVPPGAHLAKATPTLVASGRSVFGSPRLATLEIRLTSAGQRLLQRTKSLKLVAKGTFTPAAAKPVSVKKSFTLNA